jgi:hypothetical protein
VIIQVEEVKKDKGRSTIIMVEVVKKNMLIKEAIHSKILNNS